MSDRPTKTEHKHQIVAYGKREKSYELFAEALGRVLRECCRDSLPEAIVQTRAKTVASFAEKCVRKWDKYKDPVNQFKDLCGGRVIVQTLEHVDAVRRFIEENFDVVERDDKSSRLKADQFGYRDMHFIIRLKSADSLSFTTKERREIGDKTAELQVRTWVQHAWADTLHDRMYKTPLRMSAENKRTGNLLAAVMEEGDRGFNRLAGELDGMLSNYSAYASPADVENEIEVQRLLLANAEADLRPGIALQLARLIARKSEWAEIATMLKPHIKNKGPLGLELRSELGHALCRKNRARVEAAEYRAGQRHLEEVIEACEQLDLATVPNLRRIRSIRARALARLAWSLDSTDASAHEARDRYAKAAELEPGNPYFLAEMLGFELNLSSDQGMLNAFRATINEALRVCRDHQISLTELPAAYFTAGRFLLLLGEKIEALNVYARGVRYCLSGQGINPCEILDHEIEWLQRINRGRALPEKHVWVHDLLKLAIATCQTTAAAAAAARNDREWPAPVLIVAGGAATMPEEQLPTIGEMLHTALADFPGTVISGGTMSGVPGAVGAAADRLKQAGQKSFRLYSYIPRNLPDDAGKDTRYDKLIKSGLDAFSPGQILHAWKDVLGSGIRPHEMLLIGCGGGPLASFEYRLALALGVTVGIVVGSGGSADAILRDPLWSDLKTHYPLPNDPTTLRAFVQPDVPRFDQGTLEEMAKEFHSRYRNDNKRKIKPDNLKEWEQLTPTYRRANIEQAAYSVRILEAAGFAVRSVAGDPPIFADFTDDEIDRMAQLEHGRWNIERIRDGWRYGPVKDEENKIQPYLVPWEELSDEVKGYDCNAVRAFPEVLAKAGLEVYRIRRS